jgi:hypothetical protein
MTTARCAPDVSWSGGLTERASDHAHERIALEPVTEIVVINADLEMQMRSTLLES